MKKNGKGRGYREVILLAETYTTIQGETWDEIAYKVYGDEKYATLLMENNYPLLDVLIFSDGTILNTPSIPWHEDSGELPPWRNGTENEEDKDPYDDYSNEDEMEA